jgi:hypothetical protein
MNFSSLSASDRRLVITAGVTALLALLSMFDRGGWGVYVILSLLAALAAIAVVLWPQLSPNTALPVPKGTALLVLGAVAAGGFVLAAIVYLAFLFSLSSLIFDAGVVASLALLYFAWLEYQAAPKAAAPAAPAAQAPPAAPSSAPPPPPPPAEPPAGES